MYPAKHFVTPLNDQKDAIASIRDELHDRLNVLRTEGKLLEAQRLEQRTNYDLELIETAGYCNGIENYSRHFDHRAPGEPAFTLLDYFRQSQRDHKLPGYLTFLDESHVTVPQIRGMYAGDYSRKQQLVDYGWRLPSAFDNRPLNYQEFADRTDQLLYVSATPGEYELVMSGAPNGLKDVRNAKEKLPASMHIAQQLIRPTGIVDPDIDVRKTDGQLADLEKEILARVGKHQRVLVTTLTKRLAEALTEYLQERDIKVQYLHSDIETFERVEILKNLRAGFYDVVVGINLLREGLDLPEVSLVAILDADKEGFLRNETTLVQTMGRAARHLEGYVIMYADTITKSMKAAIDEVNRRRAIQSAYNKKHHITPTPIERTETYDIASDLVVDEVGDPVDNFPKKSYRSPQRKRK